MENVCKIPSNSCIHSRRCFMSGEYCSQLANIHKAREKLHTVKEIEISSNQGTKTLKVREINAFVIMNFSNMSDVAYKWQLRSFLESLKDYFYFEGDTLVFSKSGIPDSNRGGDDDKPKCSEKDNSESSQTQPSKQEITKVYRINVIRADSNYDSNYVICNRVCQQIQIADLIVVDVSSENNNVFYEFGMAMAMRKLILPICFSESFYQIKLPAALEAYIKRHFDTTAPTNGNDKTSDVQKINDKIEYLKRHIDCYPWRRTLFENYGLRYRNKRDSDKLAAAQKTNELSKSETITTTQYIAFQDAVEPRYGFSDLDYSRFPYAEAVSEDNAEILGKRIYTRLEKSYNNARYEDNTLVVYTMNGFLNGEQAGTCIYNFYTYYTKKFREEQCFCGDRVGILLEPSDIPERVKDAKDKRHLLYNVGDIIHLGTNEATFAAQRDMIKTADYLTVPKNLVEPAPPFDTDTLLVFTKNHIRNRAFPIYPHRPIYVSRMKDKLQTDLLDDKQELGVYYCYFHVMLRTLKYVNEVVVDISKNALASLFWLGAAHGANVNAITVQHEQSDQERILLTGSPEKRERAIFDVAGLWSALLRSHEVDRFYQQLASVQKGIDQRTKLILQDHEARKAELDDMLYGEPKRLDDYPPQEKKSLPSGLQQLLNERKQAEKLALESYYRDRFWKPMMRSEHLHIFFSQGNPKDGKTSYPKIAVSKWDVDALATLSHYLSVRTHVGEYSFEALKENTEHSDGQVENFIAIGSEAKPLHSEGSKSPCSLAEAILEKQSVRNCIKSTSADNNNTPIIGDSSKIIHVYVPLSNRKDRKPPLKKCLHSHITGKWKIKKEGKTGVLQFQGFFDGTEYLYSQIPCPACYVCGSSQNSPGNERKDPSQGASEKNDVEDHRIATITENRHGIMKCVLPNGMLPGSNEEINSYLKDALLQHMEEHCCLKCGLKPKQNEHYQVAQLILWREIDRKENQVNYQAALNGASGPATKALSTLVVNDSHRKRVFHWENGKQDDASSIRTTPLSIMQQELRKELVARIQSELEQERANCVDKGCENKCCKDKCRKDKLIYASILYLNSVLYRYFIPFLSLEDENRIVNGLTYYLASLAASERRVEKESTASGEGSSKYLGFDCTNSIAQIVSNTLQKLCGVEAFYQVKVSSEGGDTSDTRSCVDIDVLSLPQAQGGRIPPRCLFFEQEDTSQAERAGGDEHEGSN